MQDLLYLLDFSEFDFVFCFDDVSFFGDMWLVFYVGYEEVDCEYVQIGLVGCWLVEGKILVFIMFVVFYLFGFLVLVLG